LVEDQGACQLKRNLKMRVKFDKNLLLNWIHVDDALPLDNHIINDKCPWGLLTNVFVLILDEEDLNYEPTIVQIGYLLDFDKVGKWVWCDGSPYPECHAKNIKYWAKVPNYTFKSVLESYKK
jgi:hypothetical protein